MLPNSINYIMQYYNLKYKFEYRFHFMVATCVNYYGIYEEPGLGLDSLMPKHNISPYEGLHERNNLLYKQIIKFIK